MRQSLLDHASAPIAHTEHFQLLDCLLIKLANVSEAADTSKQALCSNNTEKGMEFWFSGRKRKLIYEETTVT